MKMTNTTKLLRKVNKAFRRMLQLQTREAMIRHYTLLLKLEARRATAA